MKKYLLISMMMLNLAACNQSAEPVQSNQTTTTAATSQVLTPHSSSGSLQTALRADYQKQCVIDALGGKAASTPEQHDFAYNMCDCVYDESIKIVGSQQTWEKQIAQFDPQNPDPKIKEVSDKAIQICGERHHLNRATASASVPN